MAKVQKVEDLIAWQKAEALAELVYSACRSGELARDFGLRDQMQRAAVSVMSNIAEGFERKTTTDFSHFLYISKGSLGELKSQLFLAARLKLIPPSVFGPTYSLADETGKVISGLIASLTPKQGKSTH
jgi:four helix bundle protein